MLRMKYIQGICISITIVLLCYTKLHAQNKKPATKKDDDLISIINKVLVIVNDTTKSVAHLAPSVNNEEHQFVSGIKPSASDFAVVERKRTYIKRSDVVISWQWVATKTSSLKATALQPEQLKPKWDSILNKSFPIAKDGWKVGNSIIQTRLLHNSSTLQLSVSFEKPSSLSVTEVIKQSRRYFLASLENAVNDEGIETVTLDYCNTLINMGVDANMLNNEVAAQFPIVANKSIVAAFWVLIRSPYPIDVKKLKAACTPEQQKQLEQMARDYQAGKKPQPTQPVDDGLNKDVRELLSNFPKLNLPFRFDPYAINSLKKIDQLTVQWSIPYHFGSSTYALGRVDVCKDVFTLLTVEANPSSLGMEYNFCVLEVSPKGEKKITRFPVSIFKNLNGSMCKGCSLAINAKGIITIGNNEWGSQKTAVFEPCPKKKS